MNSLLDEEGLKKAFIFNKQYSVHLNKKGAA